MFFLGKTYTGQKIKLKREDCIVVLGLNECWFCRAIISKQNYFASKKVNLFHSLQPLFVYGKKATITTPLPSCYALIRLSFSTIFQTICKTTATILKNERKHKHGIAINFFFFHEKSSNIQIYVRWTNVCEKPRKRDSLIYFILRQPIRKLFIHA